MEDRKDNGEKISFETALDKTGKWKILSSMLFRVRCLIKAQLTNTISMFICIYSSYFIIKLMSK